MSSIEWDVWRHAVNVIQRSSYGVNGKKHFDLQKERMKNMADGGYGGTPNNAIMIDTSEHEGSIRQLHFSDWSDSDFQAVLDIISEWEDSGTMPKEPAKPIEDVMALAVEDILVILRRLDRDDQVDVLNEVAEELGVIGDEDATE